MEPLSLESIVSWQQRWAIKIYPSLEIKGDISFPILLLTSSCFIVSSKSPKRLVGLIAIFSSSCFVNRESQIKNKTAWIVNIAMLRILFNTHFCDRAILAALGGVIAGNDLVNDGTSKNNNTYTLEEKLRITPKIDLLWNDCVQITYLDTRRLYYLFLDTILTVAVLTTLFSLKNRLFRVLQICSFVITYLSDNNKDKQQTSGFNYALINLTASIVMLALLIWPLRKKSSLIPYAVAIKTGSNAAEYIQERKNTVSKNKKELVKIIKDCEWKKVFHELFSNNESNHDLSPRPSRFFSTWIMPAIDKFENFGKGILITPLSRIAQTISALVSFFFANRSPHESQEQPPPRLDTNITVRKKRS